MIALIRPIERWFEMRPGRASTLLAWTNQGLSIFASLAIVPLIFYKVATKEAFFWFPLLYWAGLFYIFDFGLSQCISRQITFSHGHKGFMPGRAKGHFLRVGGLRTLQRTVAASRFLFRMVTLLILVFSIIAERTFLFRGQMEAGLHVHLTWYLIVLSSIIINETRVYGTALTGMLLIPQIRAFQLGQTLLQNALLLIVLFTCPTLEMLALALIFSSLFMWMGQRILWARAKPPGFQTESAKWSIVARLWHSSWEQGVASTSAYFIYAINPSLIGFLLGPLAATTYVLPLRISTILFTSLSEIVGPQVNFMVRLYSDRSIHGLLVRFFRLFIVVGLISPVVFTAYALAGPWLIHTLSYGKTSPPAGMFWVIAAYQTLVLLQTLLAMFITAHGHQPFVRPAVACAILNVSFFFILALPFGLMGAVWATLLAQLLTTNWYVPWYASRLFKEHFQQVPFAIAWRDALASLRQELRLLAKLVGRKERA